MLRTFVGVLLAANAWFFAWSQGHLAELGWPVSTQSEPHRLAQQLNPAAVIVRHSPDTLWAPSAGKSPDPGSPATAQRIGCWYVEGLSAEQWAVWRAYIKDLEFPDGTWSVNAVAGNGRWMVYAGRYGAVQLERKKAELGRLGLDFQELLEGPWAMGLSLGSFDSEEAAQARLEALRSRGVRSASIQAERPDLSRYTLRLHNVGPVELDAAPSNDPPLQRCV